MISTRRAASQGELKTFLILLNPVAPHITEEMWADCGFGGRLYQQAWPEYDEAKTVENTVEIAVQINGKTKVLFLSQEIVIRILLLQQEKK